MSNYRRWYDNDPTLKEAMELLSISSENTKDMATSFISKLQEQIAADVIEKIYETVLLYKNTGNRWYDDDPVMMKAIELLRVAPPEVQKTAARKLIKALSENDFEIMEN